MDVIVTNTGRRDAVIYSPSFSSNQSENTVSATLAAANIVQPAMSVQQNGAPQNIRIAINSELLAELASGSDLANPSCQVLPYIKVAGARAEVLSLGKCGCQEFLR